MSNKVYDYLKYIAVIGIPALILFINTLGEIWGFNYTTEISATISAVGVFLGMLIQISSAKYNKDQNENKDK